MTLQYPIGTDDFQRLRERGLVYIDKTRLIREILDRPGIDALLICRPRRFGKSLNLSTLRYFFERTQEPRAPLFEGLEIWQAGEPYRTHFQRYPVVALSFKEVKQTDWRSARSAIRREIERVFDLHREVLDSPKLSANQRRNFKEVLEGSDDDVALQLSLQTLTDVLHTVTSEPVVVLIDEYDEPIRAGYLHGFLADAVQFFRPFLGAALKGNPHLFKAVLTGITRVAKESIFSDLNNLGVFTLTAPELRDCFGFTEAEVVRLLEDAGHPELLSAVRDYYNGYLFGGPKGIAIYNPWSILSFLGREGFQLQGWWLSTSSNDLIRELIDHHALQVDDAFARLLEGGYVVTPLDDTVVFEQLRRDPRALWSLLVFSGYLKAAPEPQSEAGEPVRYRLSIPNREVREVYTSTFQQWLQTRMTGHGGDVSRLTLALLQGDVSLFEEQLQAFVLNVLSHHDLVGATPGSPTPEQIYHAFLAGLLATLEPEYRVRSNRESGNGRPDVLILPTQPGRPGVVLELKIAHRRRKSLKVALAEGLEQLRTLNYAAELRAAGATPIHALVIAFDGKRVAVRKGLADPSR